MREEVENGFAARSNVICGCLLERDGGKHTDAGSMSNCRIRCNVMRIRESERGMLGLKEG